MKVALVSGPPCAGKTTYVDQHRTPDDVVIDFDALAHALGYPRHHVAWPADAHPARMVALRARASAVRAATEQAGDHTVWIVSTNPGAAPRGVTIDETHELDPGRDECYARAVHREDPPAAYREIEAWYADHQPDTTSRSW